jgi:hypothetical protein
MISLCSSHHPKADNGSFTAAQLRELKSSSWALSAGVKGRFDWRRRDLVARIGGNFYVNNSVMVRIGGHNVVAQRRDEDGMLLLSVNMTAVSPGSRLRMVDHEWLSSGTPTVLESPPSGRRLHAEYANGDVLTIEFWEARDGEAFTTRYSKAGRPPIEVPTDAGVQFPLAVAEIAMEIPGSDISFGKDTSVLAGGQFTDGWFIHAGLAALVLDEPTSGR